VEVSTGQWRQRYSDSAQSWRTQDIHIAVIVIVHVLKLTITMYKESSKSNVMNVSAVKQYVYAVDKSEKMGTKIVLTVSISP